MGGEYRAGRNRLQRRLAAEVPLLDLAPRPLQYQKGGMTFVDVIDGRMDIHFLKGADTAHAKNNLLLDAGLLVTAVQLMGDVTVLGIVFRKIGVQQQHTHHADLGLPNLDDHFAARKVDLDMGLAAVMAHGRMDGQVVEIGIGIGGDLVAVVVDTLREITLTVEQTDRNEGQAQVGRGLTVVTGQDAQATGIDWETFVETKFGAEIGHHVAGHER